MRYIFIFAVFLFAPMAGVASAQEATDDNLRYRTCLAKAHSTPSKAYEDALIWQNEGGAGPARHCGAMALLGLHAYAEGAQKLEALAYAPDIGDNILRTQVLIQSGEAWLQAERAEDAFRVLTSAVEQEKSNPDVYTNRARALMALENPGAAHGDLDTALRLRPNNALALRLRATILLYEHDLTAAQKDIDTALKLDPVNVDALLVRGQIREAIRLQ